MDSFFLAIDYRESLWLAIALVLGFAAAGFAGHMLNTSNPERDKEKSV